MRRKRLRIRKMVLDFNFCIVIAFVSFYIMCKENVN